MVRNFLFLAVSPDREAQAAEVAPLLLSYLYGLSLCL